MRQWTTHTRLLPHTEIQHLHTLWVCGVHTHTHHTFMHTKDTQSQSGFTWQHHHNNAATCFTTLYTNPWVYVIGIMGNSPSPAPPTHKLGKAVITAHLLSRSHFCMRGTMGTVSHKQGRKKVEMLQHPVSTCICVHPFPYYVRICKFVYTPSVYPILIYSTPVGYLYLHARTYVCSITHMHAQHTPSPGSAAGGWLLSGLDGREGSIVNSPNKVGWTSSWPNGSSEGEGWYIWLKEAVCGGSARGGAFMPLFLRGDCSSHQVESVSGGSAAGSRGEMGRTYSISQAVEHISFCGGKQVWYSVCWALSLTHM